MSGSPLRCGRISYTNDLPIYAAFDLGALEFPGTLHSGVPTQLNRALLDGELDISPVSSAFRFEHNDVLMSLPGVCIGSRREVKSIVCISERHPRELAGSRIAVTRESSTGRALLDTICRASYGFPATYVETDEPFVAYRADGMPCLLIGDAAIDAALAAPADHVHDVGSLWHEYTGQDMVYALWTVRTAFLVERYREVFAVMKALREGVSWSEGHMDAVIGEAEETRPRPAGFYASYYRALNYHLDEAASRGVGMFALIAAEHGVLEIPAAVGPAAIGFSKALLQT